MNLENQRKFTVAMLVILGCFVMLVVDKLPPDNFQSIVIYAIGLYMAGNVGEHWTKNGADK